MIHIDKIIFRKLCFFGQTKKNLLSHFGKNFKLSILSSLEGFGHIVVHIYLIQGLSEPPQPSEISHFLCSGFDSVRGLLSANSCQVSKRFCNNNWTSRTLD